MVSYVRVSTDVQAEQGQGLDVQRDAIATWARGNQRRVALECADEGRSGAADVLDRPGLAQALGAITEGRVRELVVYRVDRLARDLILQEWLRGEVLRAGGELRSVSPTEDHYLRDDPDDPTGQLVRRILGAVAEYERAMIRLRMRAGLERKRAAGGFVGGRPPYGWRAERGDLVPIDAEQLVLARASQLRRAGNSWRTIADRLERDRLRTRSGTMWTAFGISRAVLNSQAARHQARSRGNVIDLSRGSESQRHKQSTT